MRWLLNNDVMIVLENKRGDDSHLNFAEIVDGKVSVKSRKLERALEPQPPVEKLVILIRSYATLKDDPNYQRQVSG